ncbi:hypothetical protein [Novosphingobium sp. MMS21-SN21R]|uniref:hypothetical protein n=1 Tax=Novosphingobium sp. MMS21-SN21R TaxID=2969298 RepID=UPI002886781E|nr:hypothetical protein [Novosphingobium sp. MMS21-SN21R]MDT0506932.1 hypothetical protein [Novosphingobium sp. MMS21-SN21R]
MSVFYLPEAQWMLNRVMTLTGLRMRLSKPGSSPCNSRELKRRTLTSFDVLQVEVDEYFHRASLADR